MAEDDDDRFNSAVLKVVDAAFDNGFVAERQERLESSHAAGLAGGEENCCYVIHSEILGLKITQGAQSVLPRHLLAPLIDEISVIERSRFYVRGFGGSLDLIVC